MKIRQGFVSNSSSSSFVLAFGEKPKSAKELQKQMFGSQETFHYYDYTTTTEQIAKAVFDQLEEPLDLGEIIEELTSGWLEDIGVSGLVESFDFGCPDVWIDDGNGNDVINPDWAY